MTSGMICRRDFIRGSSAVAGQIALFGCRTSARRGPGVRFGILSDTHVTGSECAAELRRALEFFREADVDAVLHCGDVTDLGYLRELEAFKTVWNEIMPRSTRFIAAMGNRDLSDTGKFPKEKRERERDQLLIGSGRVFGIRSFDVNGVNVVAADWKHEGELETYMTAHPELRDPSRPLIVIQHPHPRGTVFEADGWMADDGRAGCYLRMFPKAMVFSGHSHVPLNELGSLWRGDFTSAAAGSYYLGPATAQGGRELSILDVSADGAMLHRYDLSSGETLASELVFASLRCPVSKKAGEIRFVQWNIGNFSFGKHGETAIPAGEADARAGDYRRMIGSLDADIIGLCEFNPAFDKGGGKARGRIFGGFPFFEDGPHQGYQGNAVASRTPVRNVVSRPYVRRIQPTYMLCGETELAGTPVRIVQTHLDLDAEVRAAQIAELAECLKDEQRVILSGDFNVSSAAEYAPLEAIGLAGANFSRFGTFPTHRRRSFAATPAIDNVFVRGFELTDVAVGDPSLSLSDHRPLVCTLKTIGKINGR